MQTIKTHLENTFILLDFGFPVSCPECRYFRSHVTDCFKLYPHFITLESPALSHSLPITHVVGGLRFSCDTKCSCGERLRNTSVKKKSI